jgi:uncharacterized membrane protein HdeD (DUF308 family)
MSHTPTATPPYAVALGRHWGLLLASGMATLVLGVLVLVWPGLTLLTLAVLVAVQLLIGGVVDVARAIAAGEASAGQRVLFGLLGALSVLVGMLALRSPLQTLAVLALILGAWWVVSGIMELVVAFGPDVPHRFWSVLSGLVSVVAGVVVLSQPRMSLGVLVWFAGIWLLVHGGLLVGASFAVRSATKRFPEAPTGPAAAPATA